MSPAASSGWQRDAATKILDFGLAKLADQPPSDSDATTQIVPTTGPDVLVGTPSNMSAEPVTA